MTSSAIRPTCCASSICATTSSTTCATSVVYSSRSVTDWSRRCSTTAASSTQTTQWRTVRPRKPWQRSVSATLAQHFRRRVEPALRTFVFEPRQQHPWVSRRWNNNAAESVNHLLKLSIEWHPRRVPELVDRLYKVASLQMTDLRRSLYCHGNYTLVEPFSRFQMPHTAWQVKTSEEKESLFDDFLAFTPTGKCAKTVTSSDGVVTMPATPRIARKPGQRKRPRAERARTER